MVDTPIGGRRLWSYRCGDRSEYLATYGLSRFSFVYPFPRQEDFGVVDLLCVLTKQEGTMVYPETAFYVQVKSDTKAFKFGRGALRWMSTHMDHPLFVCVAEKAIDTLSIYALTPVTEALFLEESPAEITISMSGAKRSDPIERIRDESGVRFELEMGPPILHKTLTDLEADEGEAYAIMRPWVQNGADNAARRRIGRASIKRFPSWQTNVPVEATASVGLSFYGAHERVENEIAPILTSLAHSYRDTRQAEKLDALAGFLDHLRPHLDAHGRMFADRELIVDELTEDGPEVATEA